MTTASPAGSRRISRRGLWYYEPHTYQPYRYVLGRVGRRPLVCIGINPSTAQPGALDPTLKSVERLANANGFDSWIMFNVYPQRATNPNDMDKTPDRTLCDENLPLAAGRAGPDRAHHVGRMGYPD